MVDYITYFLTYDMKLSPKQEYLFRSREFLRTRIGANLQGKYKNRWELMHGPKPKKFLEEFGDEIDIVIFDQLFGYTDETSDEDFVVQVLDHSSKPTSYGGLNDDEFGNLMKDVSQPIGELTFFHKKSGLSNWGA